MNYKANFDISITYTKGDIAYFHPYEWKFNPSEKQEQFSIGQLPAHESGWHIYDEKIEGRNKLFEILTDLCHEIIDREEAYKLIKALNINEL